jgi:hypothetical protein
MSECVISMKMPKSCDVCPCLDDYGDYPRCRISGEQRGYNFPTREKRMPNCPIICQLPEGHGRLVDADKLADNMKARKAFFGRMSDPQCLVEDAPTIVPAERGKV